MPPPAPITASPQEGGEMQKTGVVWVGKEFAPAPRCGGASARRGEPPRGPLLLFPGSLSPIWGPKPRWELRHAVLGCAAAAGARPALGAPRAPPPAAPQRRGTQRGHPCPRWSRPWSWGPGRVTPRGSGQPRGWVSRCLPARRARLGGLRVPGGGGTRLSAEPVALAKTRLSRSSSPGRVPLPMGRGRWRGRGSPPDQPSSSVRLNAPDAAFARFP